MYLLTTQDICSLVVLHSQPRRDNRYDRQFETQTLQMREMNQELVDVKQTLAYTQKGTHTKALVICAFLVISCLPVYAEKVSLKTLFICWKEGLEGMAPEVIYTDYYNAKWIIQIKYLIKINIDMFMT